MIKCRVCHQLYERCEFEKDVYYANIVKDVICGSCYEELLKMSSFICDGEDCVDYNEYFAIDKKIGTPPPDWFWENYEGREWNGFRYVSKFKLKEMALNIKNMETDHYLVVDVGCNASYYRLFRK